MQAVQGLDARVIKLGRIRPVDPEAVRIAAGSRKVFFFEEGVRSGGVGEAFALRLLEEGFTGPFSLTAIPDCFVPQATVDAQLRHFGLDADSIRQTIQE